RGLGARQRRVARAARTARGGPVANARRARCGGPGRYHRRPVTYRAVFFDAGETLVHPHPSFPELFALILKREGFDTDPAELRDALRLVFEHFTRAAREKQMWTTSPERSRALWLSIYRSMLAKLSLPAGNDLPERLYSEFTQLSNYRLFPDVTDVLERFRGAGYTLGVVSN